LGPALDFGNRRYAHLPKPISVKSDSLAFDGNEHGPCDELRLQFEAVTQFGQRYRQVIKAMIEMLIVKHETKRQVGRISG